MTVQIRTSGASYQGVTYSGGSIQTLAPGVETLLIAYGLATPYSGPVSTSARVVTDVNGNVTGVLNADGTTASLGGGSSLPTDANGNILANVVPRTNTLSALLATAMGAGEVASATDTSAIVIGSGMAPVAGTVTENKVLQPFPAIRTLTISASTPVTQALIADCARLQITIVGTAAVTLTISTASPAVPVSGQDFTVEFLSSNNTLTLNGVSLGGLATTAIFKPAYTFRYDGSAWQAVTVSNPVQYGAITSGTGALIDGFNSAIQTPTAGLIVGGFGNAVNLLLGVGQAVVRGINNTVFRTFASAVGFNNAVGGAGGTAVGAGNTANGDLSAAIGGGVALGGGGGAITNGKYATAFGVGSVASGASSFASNSGVSGLTAYDACSASTATTAGGAALSVTLTTVALAGNYVAGDQVTLRMTVGYIAATVSTGGNATTGVVALTLSNISAPTALPANYVTGILNTSVGQGAVAIGSGNLGGGFPVAIQRGELAFGIGGLSGYPGLSIQSQVGMLMAGGQIPTGTAAGAATSGSTVTTATAAEATLDTLPFNNGKLPGSSNRIVFPYDGLTAVFELSLVVKQEGTANGARCRVSFQALRSGGALTVGPVTIETAPVSVGTGVALSTTTPIAVQINTTNSAYPTLVLTPQLTTTAPGNVDTGMTIKIHWLMA